MCGELVSPCMMPSPTQIPELTPHPTPIPSKKASVRSGPGWPVFQKEGYCSPVQDKLPPLASEDSLAKAKTALSSIREGTWGLQVIRANQASTTGSKGLERNLLVLLPAPSFRLSGMFPSLRASQTPAFLRTAQESEYIPSPVIWMGRGKSIIPEIWRDARNHLDATVLGNSRR